MLWDAGMYTSIAYSRNVQVDGNTVYAAYSGLLATQKRRLRGSGTETVVACAANNLTEGIIARMKLSLERLIN